MRGKGGACTLAVSPREQLTRSRAPFLRALAAAAATASGSVSSAVTCGMPSLRGRHHGDVCYQVVVEIPARLTAKQRKLLEEYQAASEGEAGPLTSSFLERMKKLFGS